MGRIGRLAFGLLLWACPGVAATADLPLLKDAVALSPVPGVSLLVPKGWRACDPADDKLLGDFAAPIDPASDDCVPDEPGRAEFRVFDRRDRRAIYVRAWRDVNSPIRTRTLVAMTPQSLEDMRARFCSEGIPLQGFVMNDCAISVDTFDGRLAFALRLKGTMPAPTGNCDARMIGIPLDGFLLLMAFIGGGPDQESTGTLLDAMMNSVSVQ